MKIATDSVTTKLPTEQIHPNPDQPRKTFRKETIQELAGSIKQHGLIVPIVVEPDPAGGYVIVAGERRWRAVQLLGRKEMAAIVQNQTNHSGRDRKLSGIIENVQREDMNPIDEAEAYKSLIEDHGMRPSEISLRIGKSATHVMNHLERLKLPKEIQAMMRSGDLSADMRLVKAFLDLKQPKAAIALAQRASSSKMTIKGTVIAATRLKDALKAQPIDDDGSPSLRLASRRSGVQLDEHKAPPKYSALVHLGQLPPWKSVINSAQSTCAGCEIRNMASAATCGRCPLVAMLSELMKVAK